MNNLGIVLTATYKTNSNHEEWSDKLVFWSKFGWTINFQEATIIEPGDELDYVKLLISNYRKAVASSDCVYHDTLAFQTISLSLNSYDWNSGDILEKRQRLALQQLQLDEIEALGIKNLAMLHKLKTD